MPVPLTDIEAALDPQRGHRAADVTNDEALALCEALRIAVEGLEHYDHAFGSGVNARDTLAAVRELVDL